MDKGGIHCSHRTPLKSNKMVTWNYTIGLGMSCELTQVCTRAKSVKNMAMSVQGSKEKHQKKGSRSNQKLQSNSFIKLLKTNPYPLPTQKSCDYQNSSNGFQLLQTMCRSKLFILFWWGWLCSPSPPSNANKFLQRILRHPTSSFKVFA